MSGRQALTYRFALLPGCHLLRFDTHSAVNGEAQFLLATEVALRRLDGDVSKQELDLIQFATGKTAEPRSAAAQIMRREFLNSGARRGGANGLPQHLGRHSGSPNPTSLVDRPKKHTFSKVAGFLPFIDGNLYSRWDWNGADMPSLAQEAGNNPMLLA